MFLMSEWEEKKVFNFEIEREFFTDAGTCCWWGSDFGQREDYHKDKHKHKIISRTNTRSSQGQTQDHHKDKYMIITRTNTRSSQGQTQDHHKNKHMIITSTRYRFCTNSRPSRGLDVDFGQRQDHHKTKMILDKNTRSSPEQAMCRFWINTRSSQIRARWWESTGLRLKWMWQRLPRRLKRVERSLTGERSWARSQRF